MMRISDKQFELDLCAKVYPWYSSPQKGLFVRGWVFANGELLRGERLIQFFGGNDVQTLLSKMKKLDGCFALIAVFEEEILIAVDHLRSLPLFYGNVSGKWIVKDHLGSSDINNKLLDQIAYEQFSFALSTIGHKTLSQGFEQLQAGEYAVLSWNGKKIKRNYWWTYSYATNLIEDRELAMDKISNGYSDTFDLLVNALDGRTAVIPLSGGHDSRLIAYWLKKKGYKDIISYSYGKQGNEESVIAKKVAEYLEIPFYFIEYDRKGMRALAKRQLPRYLEYAGNLISVPCIQEWYAVYMLQQKYMLKDTAVFVPGFTGDFLTGRHIQNQFLINEDYTMKQLAEEILKHHFAENNALTNKNEKDILFMVSNLDYFDHIPKLSSTRFCENYERFDMLERQAKFIVNAVRTYEFWGFEWLLPEFTISQFKLWTNISLALRVNRALFFEYESLVYPKEFQRIQFAQGSRTMTKKDEIQNKISKYSIFPWTNVAHYCYNFAPVLDYAMNLYFHKNRSVNHWVYTQLMKHYGI